MSALREMLADQPVPAFRGLTVARFLADHRPDLMSARWSDGAWMASNQTAAVHLSGVADCDGVAERFERLPRDNARGMGDDIGKLAEWCRDTARSDAPRVDWGDIPWQDQRTAARADLAFWHFLAFVGVTSFCAGWVVNLVWRAL